MMKSLNLLDFAVMGLELRTLCLPLELCPQPFFAFTVYQIGSCIYAWASLDHNLPTYASQVAEMTGAYHCTQLFIG
jgi:hypothetical protein